MLPLSQRIHGRRLAVLALGAAVVIGGAYGFGSRQAQLTGPNICIRSYGPFFQTERRDARKSDTAAFPNSNFFVKATGASTVSLFSYAADGTIEKVRDLPGEYRGAAVTVLDDSWVEIAYYEPFESGFKAFVRAVRVFGGSDLGTPYPLGEFAASFEPNVRFAIDTMEPGRFVVVTNIPDGLGQRNLRAMVAGRTGGQTTMTLLGPSAVPPADTPAAVMDFDVAAVDYQQINDIQFVVAFRGADGLQLQRGHEGPVGLIVDSAYLKTISATGRDVDLASSSVRQRRAAMAYMDKGQAYAGEIILGDPSPGPIMPEQFTPVALGKAGDVLATPGVAWLTDRYYLAGIGVKSSTDASRKGVYVRRGTVGSTIFGSELRVTGASGLQSTTFTGLPGVRGRVLVSQQSSAEPENGMTASYCAGCISGVADTGEQCELPTTTGTSGSEAICDPRFCGNDEMNPGEQCDDGNTAFDDGCDALCRLECSSDGDCPSGECAGGICTNLCGNGTVEPPVCVSEGGSLSCPPPTAGDLRIVNLPGGIFPLTHTSADVNKDGRMDVVVANYTGNTAPQPDGHGLYSGTIEVFLNQGNGAFAARKQIGTFQWNDGGGDRGMDAFDADGDGDADVVVADSSENGFVLLRNDDMTFKRVPFARGFFAFHLFHGNADKDGDPDLGIDGFGNYDADYHAVLPGGAGVTFRNTSNINAQDGSYDTSAFADMDGDGDDDYLNLSGFSTGIGIAFYRSNGDGTFAEREQMAALDTSTVSTSVRMADVNRDGKMDVLVGENGFRVLVALGDGRGGSTSVIPLALPFAPRLLAVADPSADGIPDIVFGPGQGTEGRNLWYAKGNGDGTFGTPVRFVTLNPPASGRPPLSYNNSYYYNYDLHAADYDGDGRLDLSLTHALSSDSASVILFRSSIASCTQVPPVVTCSQSEECDDGSQNGQPGKCTIRCTFCGNGEIDLVNGAPEACDEGARNGEPGSGCSLTCTETGEKNQHTACVDNQCVLRPGKGTNECTSDAHCLRDGHLACTGVGACTIVQGPGMDTCSTATAAADCCDPSDPSCRHLQCDFLGESCDDVPGPGLPQCSAATQCTAFHFSCENQQCAIQPGDGPDSCASALDCAASCDNDNQCEAGESCQCLDCGGAPRCNACDNDNQCEAGESCLCGDCSGQPSCQTHTVCSDAQCVSVAGAGTNECSNPAQCDPSVTQHLACTGVGACTIVQGPGMDTCSTATAAADCCDPADPTCDHRQCDFLHQSCEVVRGPSRDQCAGGADCDDWKLGCVDDQCALVPLSSSAPACATAAQCGTGTCDSDNQCEAGESCQCLDCYAAVRCNACDGDNRCEEGESCACNDCADTEACIPHLACDVGSRQCTVVLGPGTNGCLTPDDCETDSHLACTGVGACTIVPGPGRDLCSTATAATDCCDPSDPLCRHGQCNPFTQSCLTVAGPGPQDCAGSGDCEPFHSVCAEDQCVAVPGEGPVGCLDDSMCAGNLCLNGEVDEGEQCDDGNTDDGDACTNECLLRCVDDSFCACNEELGVCQPSCGNGVVDPGESCDEGPRNRTTTPDNLAEWYCKALSCTRSECFDGLDNDGDGLGDISDAGCWRYDVPKRPARTVSLLGFLLGQTTATPLENLEPKEYLAGKEGESCPADTVDRGAYCALTCEAGDICPGGEACPQDGVCPIICGNGAIDEGEQCDDGNLIDGDLCANSCRLNECTGLDCPRCGDGVYQHAIGEQCDDGNAVNTDECTNNCRTHCDGDADCPGKCDLATNQCLPPLCGDGEVNQTWERCDDGDVDNEDSCNNQCQPTCKADADCESGKCNEKLLICMPICGNGAVNPGEQCDDGNVVDTDACTNACQMTCTDDSTCDCDEDRGVCRSPCGNGRLDEGESCDDGNTDDRDQCTNLCRVRCRPGTLCPDQQACPQNGVCPLVGVCGDGEVNSPFEQCDDGNKNDADACTNACTVRCDQNVECPNGLLCTAGECSECSNSLQCDGGFCVAGRCRAALPICGNGVMEPGEACDDANADDADGCTTACRFAQGQACAASAQCQTHLCQAGVCAACSSAGECGSGLRCAEGNCLFGSLQCGDGVVQAGEACDDANFVEQDACTTACLLPFGASCSHATQCASTICASGSCTPCRADSECSSGLRCAIGMCLSDAQMALLPNICGNGFPDEGEQCDDGNAAYGDGCTPSCAIGNGPSRSEVAANVAVQMPFIPMRNVGGDGADGDGAGYGLHAGAGGNLSDSGPATVAVMAAGAAAGAAWVRRRLSRTKR